MSDYFGNLVARSIEPSVGVRPRIPSMFEPSSGPAPRGETVELEADSHDQAAPSAPTTKKSSAFPKMAQTTEPSAARDNNSENNFAPPISAAHDVAANSKPIAGRPPESVQVTNDVPPARIPRVPAAIRPVVQSTLAAQGNLPPASKPQILPPKTVEPLIQHRAEPTAPLRSDVSPKTAPAPTNSIAVPRAQNAHSASTEIPVRPARPAREPNSFSAAVAPRRAATRLPTTPMPAPQPTIQVTIGRLEVRAAAPTTNLLRAKTKKEPAMSLETYLQRRAEGSRR